jgi:dienelactone hydrolase
MALKTEIVEYFDGDTKCIGTATWDTEVQGKKPGVLIGHAWGGRDEFCQLRAEEMAELGYVGFAFDMYGHNKRGNSPEENGALMTPFVEDRAKLLSRVQAAFEAVKAHSEVEASKVSILGFCFGGMCALDLARSGADIKAAISFHGLFKPNGMAPQKITARILALHGYDDPLADPASMMALADELTAAECDWQIHAYGKVGHSFTNPSADAPDMGMKFDATAKRRAWAAAKQLLVESFAEV